MYLQLAIRNLGRTKVRSALAIVGIIIGVTAITSIGIFGENLKHIVLESFGDIANEVIILPNFKEGYKIIDEKTIEIVKKSPYSSQVIPVKTSSEEIRFRDKKRVATVYGMDERAVMTLFEAENGTISLKAGRCVIGKVLADALGVKVGSKISVDNHIYRISAILKKEGARFDITPNSALIISEKAHKSNYTMVIVKLKNLDEIEPFKDFIEKTVNLKKEKVDVIEMKRILDRINKAFNQVNLFLMAIAGISLLVAGVSILNIMLMSTIERTKEIGVMRAIGAQKTTILKIFLLEALMLGVGGSIVGSLLSIAGGYLITKLIIGRAVSIFSITTLFYIFGGFFFGIITSVLSGLYPAWKASNLEPIEALRYE